MPIYEFFSPDTNRIYSFYARTLAEGKILPRCPDQPGARMERLISRFAVTGNAREKPEESADAPDPRMENVMVEMEREMSTMNEDNPDPRQLGRMMRKMTEATGQPVPEAMQQMIQRLEKGEDPEKLEAEFGDALEKLGMEADPDGGSGSKKSRVRPPRRDPKLYEMRDYAD